MFFPERRKVKLIYLRMWDIIGFMINKQGLLGWSFTFLLLDQKKSNKRKIKAALYAFARLRRTKFFSL
jgi:hypothetical protein